FDEQFKVGVYEDADFILRCKKQRIKVGTTGAVFVHHFGQVTQKYVKKNNNSSYEIENEVRFNLKWGIVKPNLLQRYIRKIKRNSGKLYRIIRFGHDLKE
ncbi:MAG: hypothetical protein NTX32_00670, partial [Candidatus Firestonebacteria bacterium]|nr:hypothetical protein [Candidatus Firestonebacteria bacterium]